MKKSSLRDAVNRIFTKGLSEKMRQAFLYREAESVAKFGSLMKEITNLAHGGGTHRVFKKGLRSPESKLEKRGIVPVRPPSPARVPKVLTRGGTRESKCF